MAVVRVPESASERWLVAVAVAVPVLVVVLIVHGNESVVVVACPPWPTTIVD